MFLETLTKSKYNISKALGAIKKSQRHMVLLNLTRTPDTETHSRPLDASFTKNMI